MPTADIRWRQRFDNLQRALLRKNNDQPPPRPATAPTLLLGGPLFVSPLAQFLKSLTLPKQPTALRIFRVKEIR
jgi:hypothetical protein